MKSKQKSEIKNILTRRLQSKNQEYSEEQINNRINQYKDWLESGGCDPNNNYFAKFLSILALYDPWPDWGNQRDEEYFGKMKTVIDTLMQAKDKLKLEIKDKEGKIYVGRKNVSTSETYTEQDLAGFSQGIERISKWLAYRQRRYKNLPPVIWNKNRVTIYAIRTKEDLDSLAAYYQERKAKSTLCFLDNAWDYYAYRYGLARPGYRIAPRCRWIDCIVDENKKPTDSNYGLLVSITSERDSPCGCKVLTIVNLKDEVELRHLLIKDKLRSLGVSEEDAQWIADCQDDEKIEELLKGKYAWGPKEIKYVIKIKKDYDAEKKEYKEFIQYFSNLEINLENIWWSYEYLLSIEQQREELLVEMIKHQMQDGLVEEFKRLSIKEQCIAVSVAGHKIPEKVIDYLLSCFGKWEGEELKEPYAFPDMDKYRVLRYYITSRFPLDENNLLKLYHMHERYQKNKNDNDNVQLPREGHDLYQEYCRRRVQTATCPRSRLVYRFVYGPYGIKDYEVLHLLLYYFQKEKNKLSQSIEMLEDKRKRVHQTVKIIKQELKKYIRNSKTPWNYGVLKLVEEEIEGEEKWEEPYYHLVPSPCILQSMGAQFDEKRMNKYWQKTDKRVIQEQEVAHVLNKKPFEFQKAVFDFLITNDTSRINAYLKYLDCTQIIEYILNKCIQEEKKIKLDIILSMHLAAVMPVDALCQKIEQGCFEIHMDKKTIRVFEIPENVKQALLQQWYKQEKMKKILKKLNG